MLSRTYSSISSLLYILFFKILIVKKNYVFYRLNYKNNYLINIIIQKNINLKKKLGGFESEIKKISKKIILI
jgi:hypothetical protein